MDELDDPGDEREENGPTDDEVEPEVSDLEAEGDDDQDDADSDSDADAADEEAEDAEDEDDEDAEDDEDPAEDEDEDYDEEEGHPEPEVTVEVSGLSLYTHFGVTAAERETGQRLIVDLRLDVGECDATVTDRVQDTVDYGEVCQLVYLISQQREYRTLERFCAAVADRLIDRYVLHSVWVKAAKPEPPIPLPLAEVSVEVWREA
jgi:dihydroneopterin aldolase